MTAPPKRAATPTAPVAAGAATPGDRVFWPPPPAVDVAAGYVVVGVLTPLVNGIPAVPLLAPV